MEQHIIEIAPEQVVRWLKAEIAARPDAFDIMTERDFIVAEIGNPEAVGIDDETDIGEGAAIGLMEIRPMHPPKDWVLRVRAEDELAEHVPLDHSVWDTPEEIDLQTFEDLFVVPGRAAIDVTLEVDGPRTKHRLQPFIEDIRNDRHPDATAIVP